MEQRGIGARPIEGCANVVDMVMTVMPHLYEPNHSRNVKHIIADDETGAVHAELVAKLAAIGQPHRNDYVYLYRFVNGKIAEVWEFTDTDYADVLFMPAEATNNPLLTSRWGECARRARRLTAPRGLSAVYPPPGWGRWIRDPDSGKALTCTDGRWSRLGSNQ